jgi:hypothetical protein
MPASRTIRLALIVVAAVWIVLGFLVYSFSSISDAIANVSFPKGTFGSSSGSSNWDPVPSPTEVVQIPDDFEVSVGHMQENEGEENESETDEFAAHVQPGRILLSPDEYANVLYHGDSWEIECSQMEEKPPVVFNSSFSLLLTL